MRVVSISVNGLKQAVDKGFFEWVDQVSPDVICMQDHRMRVVELEDGDFRPKGYEGYYLDAENVENGGVGIYSRIVPKAIMMGFAYPAADMNGAFLQADFDSVSVASVLIPSGRGSDEKQAEKDDFLDAFGAHLQKTLRKRRQFLFCGNFQTAHLVSDASPRHHKTETSGFLAHERDWMDRVIGEWGYVDAFRRVNGEKNQFTCWPEWAEGWRRQAGCRLDYQLATPGLKNIIDDAWIDMDTRFSDHAPLIIDYQLDY